MKLDCVEVSIVGTSRNMMYGVRILDTPEDKVNEMIQYAKSIGGKAIQNTVWFETASYRTIFLLRYQ